MPLTINGEQGIVYNNLNADIKNLLMPKNWIINGQFEIWQRGTSQTTAGYGSDDRFYNNHAGSTKTHSRQAFTVGQTDVPNNPKYFSRTVVSSVAGTSNIVVKRQIIEDVTKLTGKTVALSFWAKADANKNISIEFEENFGTGGSPSVIALGVQKFALTTAWQRFTKIVTLPGVSGKTIGADNSLQIRWWFDAGTDFNARTDSLGHQSGTFDIANVSLVEGSVAVECQNQPYADVLRECMRYYQRFGGDSTYDYLGSAFTSSTTAATSLFNLATKMRISPILEYGGAIAFSRYDATYYALSSLSLDVYKSNDVVRLIGMGTGLTPNEVGWIRKNNDVNAFIAFNAEL